MKQKKTKNNKGIWITLFVFLAVMAVLNITGVLSFGSGSRIGWIENKASDKWSASYFSFSGVRERNLNTGGQSSVLHVEIETTFGEISLEIKDRDKQVVFSQDNIPTSSFDIDISGAVTAQISAKGHRGSFSITW